MARKKTITLSITKFIYIAYMWRLLFGKTIRQTVEQFTTGSVKDTFVSEALAFIDRLEESGMEIVVSGTLATILLTWFRKAVGSKQLLRLGPLRITV